MGLTEEMRERVFAYIRCEDIKQHEVVAIPEFNVKLRRINHYLVMIIHSADKPTDIMTVHSERDVEESYELDFGGDVIDSANMAGDNSFGIIKKPNNKFKFVDITCISGVVIDDVDQYIIHENSAIIPYIKDNTLFFKDVLLETTTKSVELDPSVEQFSGTSPYIKAITTKEGLELQVDTLSGAVYNYLPGYSKRQEGDKLLGINGINHTASPTVIRFMDIFFKEHIPLSVGRSGVRFHLIKLKNGENMFLLKNTQTNIRANGLVCT